MSDSPVKPWRLIVSAPAAGAMNMAIDEAILEGVAGNNSPPTLRLYAWDPACLSLGYAQPFADVDHKRLKTLGWDLVRRSSGGRAILHADELTYALIAPADNPHFAGGVLESYRHLSQGLASALVIMGLNPETKAKSETESDPAPSPICFRIPGVYEIVVGGRKTIGSAQVRRRGAVLQHGSLPLRGDITRVCQALNFPSQKDRQEAASELDASASTLASLLGRPPAWPEAAEAIVSGFTTALDFSFERSEITRAETKRAQELVVSRFANHAWLARI